MWLEVESHQRKLCRAVDFRGTAAFAGVAPSVRFDAFGCLTASKAEAHVVGVQFLQQGRAGLELLGTAFRGVWLDVVHVTLQKMGRLRGPVVRSSSLRRG